MQALYFSVFLPEKADEQDVFQKCEQNSDLKSSWSGLLPAIGLNSTMYIIWNKFLLVTLMPQVILISLFQHCNGHNKNKRHRPTVWWDWCDILKNKCKYQWHKEVEIWNSTKLLIQIERQECQRSVLWCTKYVGFFVHAETSLNFLQINIELSEKMFRKFVSNHQDSVIICFSVSPKLNKFLFQSSWRYSKRTWKE